MNHDRLAQIRYAFFEDHASAPHALELLRAVRAGHSRRNLWNLLRHHEEWDISDGETWDRDNFDYLLGFFSMVEVACQAGFLNGLLPKEHVALAKFVLTSPPVRRYYEVNYPLLLPQAHLRRIEVYPAGPAPEEDQSLAFETFFSLSQPIETGDAVETFLWFLDGGSRDNCDIDDTIEVLGDKKSFLEHMTAGPFAGGDGDVEELEILSASVQGCMQFLQFTVPFDSLLQKLDGSPIVQSAMWHYHGYWFDQMSLHIGGEMWRVMENMVEWQNTVRKARRKSPAVAAQLERSREIQEAFRGALAHLSSGRYRYRFYEALYGSLDIRQ